MSPVLAGAMLLFVPICIFVVGILTVYCAFKCEEK